MNRNRMLMIGIAALMLSALVTFFVYRALQARIQPPEPSIQIVVAAEKLALGTRLTEDNLRLSNWPKTMPIEGSFSDPKQIIGRGVIISMLPNEPVLDSKLAPKEGGAGLTSVIPDGMRAMAVKVNDVIGVAGFVIPGTKVDVIMTGTPKKDADVTSKMILQNVQVLAAGQNVQQDANGKPQNVQVVTLLVTPEQAQNLALAAVDEHIQLALRNPLDTEHKELVAMQRTALYYEGKNPPPVASVQKAVAVQPKPKPPAPVVAPPPPPPPKPPTTVELILGGKKETVTFPEKKK